MTRRTTKVGARAAASFASASVPAQLLNEGGFALVEYQVQQFHAAARLSRLLNRTIVLPRLRCGDRTLAFPLSVVPPPDGLAPDVFRALPELVFLEDADASDCPLYYWLDLHQVETLLPCERRASSPTRARRAPSPRVRRRSRCAAATPRARRRRQGAWRVEIDDRGAPGRTTPAALAAALQRVETARLLSVRRVDRLDFVPQRRVSCGTRRLDLIAADAEQEEGKGHRPHRGGHAPHMAGARAAPCRARW